MSGLRVVENEQTPEEIAQEYLELKQMHADIAEEMKGVRKKLLAMSGEQHDAALREGRVVKPVVGAATINYVGRFRALTPVDKALLEESLDADFLAVMDTVETIGLRDGITLEVLEAILGEAKMARLAPLLETKTTSKLGKDTYKVVARLFETGKTEAAEALLSTARKLAYEPQVKGSKK